MRAASRTVALDRTTNCDGDHWNILVFPVRRIFETTVGGSASVGAAKAALDAWWAYSRGSLESQNIHVTGDLLRVGYL